MYKSVRYLIWLTYALAIVKNKVDLLTLIYLGKGREKLIFLNNGLKFCLDDLSDVYILWEVFVKKEYDVNTSSFGKIIDIGAHVGITSTFFAKKYPNCLIYAIEPNSDSFTRLKKNLKVNNIVNVKPFKLAVSSKSGINVKLYKSRFSGKSSLSGKLAGPDLMGIETVKTISLENFMVVNKLAKLDLVKIDCEGSEFDIILNLKKQTFKKIMSFIIEYHEELGMHKARDLVAKLKKAGFRVSVKKSSEDYGTGLIYAAF